MNFNKFNNQTRIVSNMKQRDSNQLGRMSVDQVKQNMKNAREGFNEHTRSIINEKDNPPIVQTNYGKAKDYTKAVETQRQIMRGFNNK